MKPSQLISTAASLVLLAGCEGTVEPPAVVPMPPPGAQGPVLSEMPLWHYDAPADSGRDCYAQSLVLGDFNGDGRQDLVAGAPPCFWATPYGRGKVSFHLGGERYFSPEPIAFTVNWMNASPRTNGRSLTVTAGNVNGDAYTDLLVRGLYGALVYTGRADVAEMMAAPAFVAPGTGIFGTAQLRDLNGDGLDDLVSVKGITVSVFLATPGAATGPFTLARTLEGSGLLQSADLDGDGTEDLLVRRGEETLLYRGCKPGSAYACEGPLAVEASWSSLLTTLMPARDMDGDGRRDFFVTDGGRLWLHLADARGAPSATPVWAARGDPLYNSFGGVVPLGDVNKDGQATEFAVRASGRVYVYFPQPGASTELKPAWAWPESDDPSGPFEGHSGLAVLSAGDLSGDGYEDLLIGIPPPGTFEDTGPGRVVALSGGRVPPGRRAPFLPEAASCGVRTDGKPDVTVDGEVLARSMRVETRAFAADSCEVMEGCVNAPGPRKLLRFSVSIPNLGRGPVVIPGPEDAPDLYQYDACHRHDHLIQFAQYALKDARGEVTATGRKQGFFLVDLEPYCMDAERANVPGTEMRISPGWADIYVSTYPCQWLDITDVKDGTYRLHVGVDELNIIDEEDVLPNQAEVTVRIQGDSVTWVK